MHEQPSRPGALRVTRSLTIPLEELRWRFSTTGGPGGQHANKASTRAEVSFDVAGSPSLGPRQRARLLDRVGATARAAAGEERSQLRNREVALERLRRRLQEGLRVEVRRVPTAVPRAARERRLADKRRQAERKRGRGRPGVEEG